MIKLYATIKLPPNIVINIDKHNLIELSTKIDSRANIESPSYGIISNSGAVTIKDDAFGSIAKYARSGLLAKKGEIEIFLIDTLSKKKEIVATFQTTSWRYDSDAKNAAAEFKDDLEAWQDIEIDSISYNFKNPYGIVQQGKAKYLYEWLWEQTPSNMLSFYQLDTKTKDILENTIIKYPMLNAGNLWAQWTKLCEICMLYIYKNSQGIVACSHTIW